MASMPETPGRGRSRFSKALPLPPDAAPTISKSPALSKASTSVNSPLPAIPPSKLSLPPIVQAIPRRPLGMTAEQRALSAALSKASNSPLYTSSPALSISRSTSENSSSTMDSISTRESSEVATTPSTPPIPPKDNQRKITKTPEPTPNLPTTFPLQNVSPPRPEIWRRRSVKSDISVTELKLDRSNGSTASPPRQAPHNGPLPQLPRSNTGSVAPGFNRKPVPNRPAPPQPEQMGSKISKITDKAAWTTRNPFHRSSSSKDESSFHNANRPPTPEYVAADGQRGDRHGDYKNLPKVVSPRSPDTPPEETIPRIPARSDSRFAPVKQPHAQVVLMPFQGNSNNDSNVTLKAPEVTHSRASSETLEVATPYPQTQPPDISRVLEPPPADDVDLKTSPLNLSSPAEQTRSPPPGSSIHFPRISSTPLPEDTVLPGMPLSITHYECYQSHRFMRGNRNLICPVACMVCAKKDREMRWRCTWCCLSACASCMQVLTQVPGKDLRIAMESIELVSMQA